MSRKLLTNFADANKALQAYWPTLVGNRQVYELTYMYRLMEHLGNPQEKFKVIHVAGTSGKTSTVYYAAALLMAAGKKVGVTVSPHVDEVNERVQINLVPLSEKQFCADLTHFLDIVDASGIPTTYFELLVAFAYWEFAQAGVDYAVVEVGMGGLTDGTNVIERADKVSIITDIGFDHMHMLGNTLGEISFQKAGIIQLHNPVFCYKQSDEVMGPISDRARQKQADLHVLDPAHDASAFDFLPLFQRRNFGLSLRAVQFALGRDDEELTPEAIEHAAHAYVPARMETIQVKDKILILDGAHNGQKLGVLADSVRQRYPGKKVAVLLSFVSNREGRLEPAVAAIAPLATHIIATSYGHTGQDSLHSSMDPQLVAAASEAEGTSSEVTDTLEAGLAALLARPEPVLLVTGSFYMLSHLRPMLARKGIAKAH